MRRGRNYTKKKLEEKLTNKQRIFCHAYIQEWNGTQSAIKAGYKKKNAAMIASENLRKPYIKKYIALIKDDIEKQVGLSKMRLINELKAIALSSISEIYEDWVTRKEYNNLPENVKKAIQEISSEVRPLLDKQGNKIGEKEYVKIKMYDKTKAIQDILKAMGWNEPEKIALDADIKGTVVILPSNGR